MKVKLSELKKIIKEEVSCELKKGALQERYDDELADEPLDHIDDPFLHGRRQRGELDDDDRKVIERERRRRVEARRAREQKEWESKQALKEEEIPDDETDDEDLSNVPDVPVVDDEPEEPAESKGIHERVKFLARIMISVTKEDDAGDGFTSFRFDTVDGGELFWDIMSNDELNPGGFQHMTKTPQTEEAEELVKNLQSEFKNANKIFVDLKKMIPKTPKDKGGEEGDELDI